MYFFTTENNPKVIPHRIYGRTPLFGKSPLKNTKHGNITPIQLHTINSIDTGNLLISVHTIAYSYDRSNLCEEDIYNLMRDALSTVTSIEVLKNTIKV